MLLTVEWRCAGQGDLLGRVLLGTAMFRGSCAVVNLMVATIYRTDVSTRGMAIRTYCWSRLVSLQYSLSRPVVAVCCRKRQSIQASPPMGCAGTKVAPSPDVEDGQIVSLTAAHRWEVSELIGRAFAGTATADPEWAFHWSLGPALADRSDPARAKLVGGMISTEFFGKTRMRYIGVRGPKGELQAACVFYRSPGGKKGPGSDFCGLMSHLLGKPPPPSFNKVVEKRMKVIDAVMKQSHEAHAAGPHWYTLTIGVEPACQGQGLGAKLMRAVSKMADEAGEACYLETSGQRNRSMYQHVGYDWIANLYDKGLNGIL